MIDLKQLFDALGQLSPAALTIIALYLITRTQRETEKRRDVREIEQEKNRSESEKARNEHESAMQAARLREIELTAADRVAQSRREAMLTDALIGTRSDVQTADEKRDSARQTLLERMDALIESNKTHRESISTTVSAVDEKLAFLVTGFNEVKMMMAAVISNKGDLDLLRQRINQIEVDASNKVVEEAKRSTGALPAVVVVDGKVVAS